jgi:hypothetical protein
MGQMDIWHGLESEVRAVGGRVAFEQARERHEALRDYPDLRTAAAAAARCRCEQRDAVVVALVAEHRATRDRMWSAAAALAMAPLLSSLVRALKNARGERNDEKSIVLLAFLEAVNQIGPADRITLRLYSETRRRALHARRASVEDFCQRSSRDVDAVMRADDVCLESRLDRVRFVLRARDIAPEPGERPATYVERIAPSPSRRERRCRRELLRNQRTASLADMREAFRCIATPNPGGENR